MDREITMEWINEHLEDLENCSTNMKDNLFCILMGGVYLAKRHRIITETEKEQIFNKAKKVAY